MNIADFIDDCKNRNLDGSILTFIDHYQDPKWSFAKLNENNLVTEVKKKLLSQSSLQLGFTYIQEAKTLWMLQ